ncbi:MAG: CDP-diacylglycerol--serine O-phosphatidyltransferase [Patescibacteria group bacterium]|nr:CDP-diacylglycerol--serine O-phosphatidyltransferase [Patescibacteria group bacterium]
MFRRGADCWKTGYPGIMTDMHKLGRAKLWSGGVLAELSVADYVTLTAVAFITSAFWLAYHGQLYLAMVLAFASMFLDYVDGAVARKYGGSPYGAVFDSLYDVLGWVLFPALVINIQLNWHWWSLVITTFYCVFCVIRLGRFTIRGYVKTDGLYYTGLPVLFSKYGLLLAFVPHYRWLAAVYLAAMIPFMVSSIRILKPHPIFAQLEAVYAVIFLWLYLIRG